MSKKNGSVITKKPTRKKDVLDLEIALDSTVHEAFVQNGINPTPRDLMTVEEAEKIQRDHQRKIADMQ